MTPARKGEADKALSGVAVWLGYEGTDDYLKACGCFPGNVRERLQEMKRGYETEKGV